MITLGLLGGVMGGYAALRVLEIAWTRASGHRMSMGSADQPKLEDQSRTEERTDRFYLLASTASLGAALAARIYPIALVPALALYTISAYRYFKHTERVVLVERRVDIWSGSIILNTIPLGFGQVTFTALGVLVMHFCDWIVARLRRESKNALAAVFEQRPLEVWVERNGVDVLTPLHKLQAGDVFALNAGDVIPAHGVVVRGNAVIEARRKGNEKVRVTRLSKGSKAFATMRIKSGRIHVAITSSGLEAIFANVSDVLSELFDPVSRGGEIIEARP